MGFEGDFIRISFIEVSGVLLRSVFSRVWFEFRVVLCCVVLSGVCIRGSVLRERNRILECVIVLFAPFCFVRHVTCVPSTHRLPNNI